MTDLRQAAQQALEALEELDGLDTETECVTIDVGDVIAALRTALAQQQAEPLTDDAVGFECRKHFWMHGTRFEDAYKVGFRDAEAAHNIKERT